MYSFWGGCELGEDQADVLPDDRRLRRLAAKTTLAML
jgi:hypothetical protein